MTDQEILEAVRRIIEPLQTEIHGIESKIDQKLEAQSTELLHGVKVLMENTVQTQINLLSEDIQIIRERMPDNEELDAMDARLSAVEAVIRKHSKDIQTLKKAQ